MRWIALLVLAGVCIGVPVIEVCSDTWPPPVDHAARGWPAWRTGRATRAIEEGMRARSAVATTVRPYYNDLTFAVLGRTMPQVVLGDDGWLYLASTVRGYPPPGWEAAIADHARLFRRLDRFFAARGTLLVVMVIPNKATVHPQRLRRERPAVWSPYPQLVRALAAAGVVAPDLLGVLRGVAAPYCATDTHWTCDGALACLRHLRRLLGERFDPLPGEPLAARLQPLPDVRVRGDLHHLLGLRRGGALDQRLTVTASLCIGVEGDDGAQVAGRPGTAFVHTGSSFSLPPTVASILSAVLERRVTDRSVVDIGAAAGLLEVAYGMLDGTMWAPRVLTFELPERALLSGHLEVAGAVRAFLAAEEFAAIRGLPIESGRLRAVGCRLEVGADGWIGGFVTGPDPHVVVELGSGAGRGEGAVALRMRIETDRPGRVHLVALRGAGAPVAGSYAQRDLPVAQVPYPATLPVAAEPVEQVLIGVDAERRFRLCGLEVVRR